MNNGVFGKIKEKVSRSRVVTVNCLLTFYLKI